MRTVRVMLVLALTSFIALVVAAGFSAQGCNGKPLLPTEKEAVEAAIQKIREMADDVRNGNPNRPPDPQRADRLDQCADLLEESLKAGRICRETDRTAKKEAAATTLSDQDADTTTDPINVNPEYLNASELKFAILVAILVHEAIHVTQGPLPNSESEWEAYDWEKWVLQYWLGSPDVNSTAKQIISKRLKTVCDEHAKYIRQWFDEREKRSDEAKRSLRKSGRVLPTLDYQGAFPPSNAVDLYNDFGDVLGTLQLGHEGPMFLASFRRIDGREVLLVGATEPGHQFGAVMQFTDMTGDGLVDQESLFPRVPLGAIGMPLDESVVTGTPTLALLVMDPGVNEYRIVLMDDLDLDGVPDTVRPLPFATSIQFPDMRHMRTIEVVSLSPLTIRMGELSRGANVARLADRWLTLRDLDGDGRADTATPSTVGGTLGPLVPTFVSVPQGGDTLVKVQGRAGTDLAVYASDPAGNPLEFLGSALSAGYESSTFVFLLRPVGVGEHLVAQDVAAGLRGPIGTPVTPPAPEIFELSAGSVLPGQEVVVSGRNFGPGSRVFLSGVEVPVAIATTTEIRFFAPPVAQYPAGSVGVEVETPGLGRSRFAGLLIHGDCNGNGVPDIIDIGFGAPDLNGNNVPDSCECCVDFNLDGEVDFSDIEGFLTAYALSVPGGCRPGADFNSDGEFDFSDIEAFLAQFALGCAM